MLASYLKGLTVSDKYTKGGKGVSFRANLSQPLLLLKGSIIICPNCLKTSYYYSVSIQFTARFRPRESSPCCITTDLFGIIRPDRMSDKINVAPLSHLNMQGRSHNHRRGRNRMVQNLTKIVSRNT